MIKKHLSKLISLALSLTIIISLVATVSYTAGAESTNSAPAKLSDLKKSHDGELAKDETVYVIADAEGSPKKIIVSDWVKNPKGLETINDKSNLKDIENVKGDETFKLDSDNMCVWDAQGNDIYYQGTSDSDLPVDVKVSYYLNGLKTSPKNIAGKSGKVTIRFDYDNKQYETVEVNGSKEKIYVPFVMLTGMILDNDKFTNVTVNHGKVINDGSHTIVAGFCLPKMKENLDLDNDEIQLDDYVEISADAEDFEFSTTMTIANNDVFSDFDFTKADNAVDELNDKLDKLTDATDKLIDGSSKLYDGISTLLEKSDTLISGVKALASGAKQLADGSSELNSGVGTLANGAKSLSDGASKLDNGASKLYKGASKLDKGAGSLKSGASQMQSGLAELASGLGTLSSNSSVLTGGALQVFNTLLSTADDQIAAAGLTADKLTVENYGDVLDGIVKSLSKDNVKKLAEKQARATVEAAVRSQQVLIEQGVTAYVRAKTLEAVLAQAGMYMTAEQYAQAVQAEQIPADTQAQINAAVEGAMASDTTKATIATETENKIQETIDTNMESDEVQAQIQTAIDNAAAGAESIKNLKKQLDSYSTFYYGIIDYTNGVVSASSGAEKLSEGSTQLKSGTATLKKGTKDLKKGVKDLKKGTSQLSGGAAQLSKGAADLKAGTDKLANGAAVLSAGVNKLDDGTGALVTGVKQLKNGSAQLRDGLKQYKTEGIGKLTDLVKDKAEKLVKRLEAISKVSTDYRSFSGISDDMSGQVNFIYKTDSVDAKD